MADEPFVLRCDQCIFSAGEVVLVSRKIGSVRKNDCTAETAFPAVAGCIMQGCCVQFNRNSLGKQKGFHLGGVIGIVLLNIRLPAKQQNQIRCSHIDFRCPVIFQSIQLIIVSITESNLNRHLAVGHILKLLIYRKSFQLRNTGFIYHLCGAGSLFQFLHKSRKVHVFHYFSVFTECSVRYFLNFHPSFLLSFSSSI